ncbi:MAG: hypothetical protein C0501_23565 [Isosphaera sp.]|nr:hypothetical protein [Isosphaera sp.]
MVLLSTVHSPLSTGCSSKRYDLIEAELRTRERELEETRVALEQARNLNRAYAQQSQARTGAPDPAAPVYIPVKDVTLGRGTGGVDEDGAPGDEGLLVVVVPRDEDGAVVKVPARLDVAAWEVSAAGIKTPIGTWAVPAEKVRPTWRGGFVSTGYFVALPWQTYPGTEKVRVAVRLTTLDGRAFEADRDVTVKVAAPPRGKAPHPTREPLPPDPLPPGVEELPPPAPAAERGARLLPPQPP